MQKAAKPSAEVVACGSIVGLVLVRDIDTEVRESTVLAVRGPLDRARLRASSRSALDTFALVV